jgi:hypothetical protein
VTIPVNFPYPRSGNIVLFDKYGSISLTTLTSGVAIEFQAQQAGGWITLFGFGIDDVTAFALSIFQITINGVADLNYFNIQDQLAEFKDPKAIAPIKIKIGDIVAVKVFNNTAATRLYGGRLLGFYDYGHIGDK